MRRARGPKFLFRPESAFDVGQQWFTSNDIPRASWFCVTGLAVNPGEVTVLLFETRHGNRSMTGVPLWLDPNRPVPPNEELLRLAQLAVLDDAPMDAQGPQRTLAAWSSFLPTRLMNEDIGDYIEDLNRRIAGGECRFVWLKVCAAIFWTGLNAIGYTLNELRQGKRSA